MFKKTRKFRTYFVNHIYLDGFMKCYKVKYNITFEPDGKLCYEAKMGKKTFSAFCEYLNDLRKLRVYPIAL